MKLATAFIYKITAPDGSVYVGQTVDIKRRLGEYRRLDCRKQPRLQTSLKKYGLALHDVEILFSGSVTKKELNALEAAYIRNYDACNPLTGLNSTKHK